MTNMQMIFLALVFASASIASKIVFSQLASKRVRQRLQTLGTVHSGDSRDGKEAWLKTIIRLSTPFARLSLPADGWEQSPLRLRFMNAGYRGEHVPIVYFAAKTLLAISLPAVLFLILKSLASNLDAQHMMAMALALATIGYYLPNLALRRQIFLRQRNIFENFADAADLMLVCIEAGLGLDAALNKVAEEMRLKSQALAEELQLVNLEMRAGSSRENSLHNLALRTGVEEVNTFATMLVQADRFGTSIGDSLRVFSDELRTRRRFRAEEMAAKIPLKLLFPLVFFIFPSLLLVLLGPAFIQIYRILLPTLTGQ